MGENIAMALSLGTLVRRRQSSPQTPPVGAMLGFDSSSTQSTTYQPLTAWSMPMNGQHHRLIIVFAMMALLSLSNPVGAQEIAAPTPPSLRPIPVEPQSLPAEAQTVPAETQAIAPQPQSYPTEAQPRPTRAPSASAAKTLAHIQVHVLEVESSKEEDADALVRAFIQDPKAAGLDNTIFFLGQDTERSEKLIRQLLDAKLAQVLSRPQVMTVEGENAQVQVGQRVAIPGADQEQQQHVGLTLDLKAQRVSDQQRMHLALRFEHSTADEHQTVSVKGKSYPVINKQLIETMIEAASGETIVVRGPKKRILLVLKPSWVNPDPGKVTHASFQQPTQPQRPRSNLALGAVVDIQKAVTSIPGAMVLSVSLKREKFQAEVLLDEDDKVNALSNALGSLPGVTLEEAQVSANNSGVLVDIAGMISNAENTTETMEQSMSALRQDVQAMRAELQELTEQLKRR